MILYNNYVGMYVRVCLCVCVCVCWGGVWMYVCVHINATTHIPSICHTKVLRLKCIKND